MTNIAYSYVRFSIAEQIKSDSFRRQTELSNAYAEKHGLTIDQSLNLHDLGISAFKGDNVASGKLGLFLEAVKSGRVKSGSFLLVESLDRISRSEIITALNVFTGILSAGITIVTLTDNRMYTRESISDIGELLYSLLIMSRAHEESMLKSKRVSAAWDMKRKKAIDSGVPMAAITPGWLRLVNGNFELIPERAEIVERIFRMSIDGIGSPSIAKTFNLEGIPTFSPPGKVGLGWYSNYIKKILKSTATYGEYRSKKAEPMVDYFPAVVSYDVFAASREAISRRFRRSDSSGTHVNLFSYITKCSECGGSLVRVNKSNKVYLCCDRGRRGVSDCGWKKWKYIDFENLFLRHIKELNIKDILNDGEDKTLSDLSLSLSGIKSRLDEITIIKERLIDAISAGAMVTEILDRMTKIKDEEDELRTRLQELEDTYKKESSRSVDITNIKNEIDQIMNGSTPEVRMRLRDCIRRLVSFIRINYDAGLIEVEYVSGKVKLIITKEGAENFKAMSQRAGQIIKGIREKVTQPT